MSKLSYEDKINLYNDKKRGISIGNLSNKYNVRKCVINYVTYKNNKLSFFTTKN